MSGFLEMFDNHVAPAIEKKAPLVREVGWQSAEKANERYRENLPDHIKDAMTITQADHSYYAFTRFALNHPVRDNFESAVNKAYKEEVGELQKGFNFPVEREKYINFYRKMMGEL